MRERLPRVIELVWMAIESIVVPTVAESLRIKEGVHRLRVSRDPEDWMVKEPELSKETLATTST